jgi:glycine/D-amino acid oxidase-like deaminating enzyme
VRKQTIHCYYLSENKHLPNAFLLEGLKETNGVMVFGTVDGDDFTKYKVGNECEDLDPHLQLRVMQQIMPSKVERITHIMPCFYSMSHDDEFIFEKHGNTIYGFGCNGRGFKHMTYHGKRIYHLISGNQAEADKYKKPAPLARL